MLSTPWDVFQRFVALLLDGRLQTHVLTSLSRALSGFAIGCAVGVSLGLISGLSRYGEALLVGHMMSLARSYGQTEIIMVGCWCTARSGWSRTRCCVRSSAGSSRGGACCHHERADRQARGSDAALRSARDSG